MGGKIELLAPGGDVDSIKAAILAGADAVYCGLNKYNARNRAANIDFENLQGILRLAHQNNCEVFLTLNIIVFDSEIPNLFGLLNKLTNTSIDGVIVQDLGLFYLLSKYFKTLKIHASTQTTTHNEGQIKFLKELDATRVNLSRELNIDEIESLTSFAHKRSVLTEVFVHGSYCISFSGLCYMSSLQSGKSGNRGRCSQPCRERYVKTSEGNEFPLNLKDNSAFFDLKELSNARVDSLKIEGRIKEFEYVYTVVETWRRQLHSFYQKNTLLSDNSGLYKVFNREFSNSFLKGEIHRDMFIDNPMSQSTHHHTEVNQYTTEEKKQEGKLELYEEKAETRAYIKKKIDRLNIDKIPLRLNVSGSSGTSLIIAVAGVGYSFEISSTSLLSDKGLEPLSQKLLLKKLRGINDTEFYIDTLNTERVEGKLYLPFSELAVFKRKILFILNDSRAELAPITIPALEKHKTVELTPTISVLISSKKDLNLCHEVKADIYFQLPNIFSNGIEEWLELFTQNPKLIPWFPSVLIGDNYTFALEFLRRLKPNQIVSNNTGIGYEAYKNNIRWIAGPYLNIVNSYSLLALKEKFSCSGAFISNEINKTQISNINTPENFKLFYSIYHPIVLMTSRQCLFHQVTGCEKNKIENTCIQNCSKLSSISNLNNESFIIEKSKGNYHNIYSEYNYLNTEISSDFKNTFSSFFIDLRDIKTETKIELNNVELIQSFEEGLVGKSTALETLKASVYPTTHIQYIKGI